MTFLLRASSFSAALCVLTALTLGGCGGDATAAAEEGTDSTSDELGAGLTGHFRLVAGTADSGFRWIQHVNLHADGTYEGDFGNRISSLSGHHYVAAGNFRVETTGSESVLLIDSDRYSLAKKANGDLQLQFLGSGLPEPLFDMKKEAAPTTITFGGAGAPTIHGELTPGGTALVLFSTDRLHCVSQATPEQLEDGSAWLAGFHATDGTQSGWLDWGINGPVKGYYRALVAIPARAHHDFSLWFQDRTPTCEHWDSNYGHNHHFAVTRH